MPDVIDAILERLSLTSLDLLDKIDLDSERASRCYSDELQKSLNAVEDAYLTRCTHEVNNKTELLVSETRKNKHSLDKYTQQFAKLQFVETHNDHHKKIEVYAQQIENFEKQIKKLIQKSGELTPDEIFCQIDETHKSIQELEAKCKELTEKLKCYEDFPANLTEAQYCISDLKERIKKKEALLESNLYGKSSG